MVGTAPDDFATLQTLLQRGSISQGQFDRFASGLGRLQPSSTAGQLMTARQSISQGCPEFAPQHSPTRSNSKIQPITARTPIAIKQLAGFNEDVEDLFGRLGRH